MKVTMRDRLELPMATVHAVPFTESHPDHPPNVPFAVAVNTTVIFDGKDVLHVLAQLRPVGELVIVPVPFPAKLTVSTGPTKHTTFAVIFAVTIEPED